MAGHSKFKNIMHRKGAQDRKRAKKFTQAAKEVYIAAKSGLPDPEMNPRLRTAIATARAINMPKDRIENAIKKASSAGEGENYEEIRYEGYASGGVAIIVEALTDNKNRTASDVRAAFNKYGGSLGETGSVSFMFEKVGLISYPADSGSADEFFEAVIEVGANDCQSDDMGHEILCDVESFSDVCEALENKFGQPESAEITWKPHNTVALDEEGAQKLIKLIDALEESDDVQKVVGNFEIPDDVMEKIGNA
jgi:YebC/PmpR family DNA-binding regulatory protein